MKKTILILTVVVFMAGTMFTACDSPAKKIENAENNVKDANDEVFEANQRLDQAVQDSVVQFRKESEAKIVAHEKSIADFKARIANEKRDIKARYEKQLADLEQKNSDMKRELDNYKAEGKDKWDAFKIKFKKDLEELGIALKGFTAKSK